MAADVSKGNEATGDENTAEADNDLGDPPSCPKKRKRPNGAAVLTQFTIRKPRWSYVHLSLHYSPPSAAPEAIDAITARQYLTSALHQFLGLTGTAIPVDFLKVEKTDVWIRVQREDCSAVVAAAGGWIGGNVHGGTCVGWKVVGHAQFLAQLVAGDGQDLFTG